MQDAKLVYIKVLLVAVIIYTIGTAIILSDLYYSVGEIKHALVHMPSGHKSNK